MCGKMRCALKVFLMGIVIASTVTGQVWKKEVTRDKFGDVDGEIYTQTVKTVVNGKNGELGIIDFGTEIIGIMIFPSPTIRGMFDPWEVKISLKDENTKEVRELLGNTVPSLSVKGILAVRCKGDFLDKNTRYVIVVEGTEYSEMLRTTESWLVRANIYGNSPAGKERKKENERKAEEQRKEEERRAEEQRIEDERRFEEEKREDERRARENAEAERRAEEEARRKKEEPQRIKRELREIPMAFVKGGTFAMGCTNEQGADCYDGERPVRRVAVDDFYIGKYEVSQKEWNMVMGTGESINIPVANVSWNDIQQFIRKLNEITGRKYRLPTEAEWEYAARGGVKSGNYKYAGSNNTNQTHKPNELGIYYMSGGVAEWVNDRYGPYSQATNAEKNPQGPSSGSTRVVRGGGSRNPVRFWRVSYRGDMSPDYRGDFVGFRLALSERETFPDESRPISTNTDKSGGQTSQPAAPDKEGAQTGGRSRASIQRVVVQNMPSIRFAYNRRSRDKPGLQGKIVVGFSINEFGQVISSRLVESTVNDPELEKTFVNIVRGWTFDRIDKPGDVTEVTYPFVLSQ